MKPLFADSSYYVALMSSKDAGHSAALEWSRTFTGPVLTTEFVLVEVANGFCAAGRRTAFGALLHDLQADPLAHILPASTDLFRTGAELYVRRPDKDWSLTDCISFVVMKERGLTDVLTTDHHFEQAGFKALLK